MHKHPGFTLIEILIVITVIAILLIITLPAFGDSRAKATHTGAMNCGRAIQNAQALYAGRAGSFATNMNGLMAGNQEILDPCDLHNPNSPFTISAANSQPTGNFDFRVTMGDTEYLVTASSITETN